MIAVPPKELALLELLVEKSGEIASHREIEERVWPNQTIRYASLARCVYSLRKRLESDGATLIQTVPRRGYRLAVTVQTAPGGPPRSAREESTDTGPQAYSHFLAGLTEASSPRPESLNKALRRFEAAVAADPDYATAYSAMADVRIYQALRGDLMPQEAYRLGLDACHKAIAAKPGHAPALAAKGWLEGLIGCRISDGLALIDKALSIDPDYARAYVYRSMLMRATGDPETGALNASKAVELDPHALINRHALSWALFSNSQADEALERELTLRDEFPQDDVAQGYVAIFSAYLGLHAQALAAKERCLAIGADVPVVVGAMAYVEAMSGHRSQAFELARTAYTADSPRCPRPWLAPVFLAIGDRARAASLVREGHQERCPWAAIAKVDPRLRGLAED